MALSRAAQQEIAKTLADLKHDPFKQQYKTPDSRTLVARVAIQETCDGQQKGAMVVVYDASTLKVVDALEWDKDPFRFVWPVEKGAFAHSGCFECGDWNVAYYDVSRKRLYWEAEGD